MKNNIDSILSIIESKRKAQVLAELKKEKKFKQNYQEMLKFEKEKHNDKIELLNKILFWAKEFSKTEQFKRILKTINSDELDIYPYWCWEHIEKGTHKKNEGKWSRLVIDKKGRLEYKSGYKWTGYHVCFYLNEKNVGKIKYEYLRNVWNYIDRKTVYRGIEDEIGKWE